MYVCCVCCLCACVVVYCLCDVLLYVWDWFVYAPFLLINMTCRVDLCCFPMLGLLCCYLVGCFNVVLVFLLLAVFGGVFVC